MLNIDLSGRLALVTGSSSGLGEAIAMALSSAGAKVAINYRNDKAVADAVVVTPRAHLVMVVMMAVPAAAAAVAASVTTAVAVVTAAIAAHWIRENGRGQGQGRRGHKAD